MRKPLRKIKDSMCFIDPDVYYMVNREALWQVLRMYDVGGKLLNGIKSIYVNSLICIRVKEGKCVFKKLTML